MVQKRHSSCQRSPQSVHVRAAVCQVRDPWTVPKKQDGGRGGEAAAGY